MNFRTSLFAVITFILSVNSYGQTVSWTQVADYGGGACSFTVSGVMNGYGYVLCENELWAYDPLQDLWVAKANFPGSPRVGAVSFVINNLLYLGTGNILFGALLNDWWKYDPIADSWTQLNYFSGGPRYAAVGFSIGSKGYITTGFASGGIYKNDIWEYSPVTDSWLQKTSMPDAGKYLAAGFAVDGNGYVLTGYESAAGDVNDVWEFDPVANGWTQKGNFSGGARRQAAGFSSSVYGYLATGGTNTGVLVDAWQYDPITDLWSGLPDLPAGGRRSAVGFTISDYAYLGIGFVPSGTTYKDFWKLPIASQPLLPIELVSFTGVSTSSGNLLEWITASEINNDYFDIERSIDATSFQSIGMAGGQGNNANTSFYEFTDTAPLSGISYYRLKQIDFNSNFSYSNVVVLNQVLSEPLSMHFGYEGGGIISIEWFSLVDEKADFRVVNISSDVLLEQRMEVKKGITKININLSSCSSGVYFAIFYTGNKKQVVQKLALF